jgi:hypothetical protein
LADDPDYSIAVNDGQTAYGVALHRRGGFVDRVVGPYRDHFSPSEDVFDVRVLGIETLPEDLQGEITIRDCAYKLLAGVADWQHANVKLVHLARSVTHILRG